MARLIEAPAVVEAAGTKPKRIEECLNGRFDGVGAACNQDTGKITKAVAH